MQANVKKIWKRLGEHAAQVKSERIEHWFDHEPERVEMFSCSAAGIWADFSKQAIRKDTLPQLFELADSVELRAAIAAMFAGVAINTTENRSVLHVALRNSTDPDLIIEGENVAHVVEAELQRMLDAAERIRAGKWQGFDGSMIRDVVHIGIGGSDLGPRMVTNALTAHHQSQVSIHFVANIDAYQIDHLLNTLNPATTLFIIASKTFGTEETLCNARIARKWIVDFHHSEDAVARHMLALSSSPERVASFGIKEDNRFSFWDWVGGRYSVWSVIGMPVAIAVGAAGFRQFLAGAAQMDTHFRTARWEDNMPVMHALTGIWNRNFLGYPTQAVVPYLHYLSLLPQYLQQAIMESNGKSVTIDGDPLTVESSGVVWGSAGTDAQHAYFQMLHQGTDVVPVEFIIALQATHSYQDSHERLLTHAIAQSEALLIGREPDPESEVGAHQRSPGNRPSTMLVLDTLNPERLGALLALYEHAIFVQGRILGINSFDQFGVELGKQLASEIRPLMQGGEGLGERDPSTRALIAKVRQR